MILIILGFLCVIGPFAARGGIWGYEQFIAHRDYAPQIKLIKLLLERDDWDKSGVIWKHPTGLSLYVSSETNRIGYSLNGKYPTTTQGPADEILPLVVQAQIQDAIRSVKRDDAKIKTIKETTMFAHSIVNYYEGQMKNEIAKYQELECLRSNSSKLLDCTNIESATRISDYSSKLAINSTSDRIVDIHGNSCILHPYS